MFFADFSNYGPQIVVVLLSECLSVFFFLIEHPSPFRFLFSLSVLVHLNNSKFSIS